MKVTFLLLALSLTACQSGHQLRIIEASEQKWIGGRKETGSGTNYEVKIIAPESNQKFLIQEICIDNQSIAFNTTPSLFSKGDTITITGRKNGGLCNVEIGMIRYQIKENSNSVLIQKIIKKDQLHYP